MEIEIRCPYWEGPNNRQGRRRHKHCDLCHGTLKTTKFIPDDGTAGTIEQESD